jgi:outer membrane protein TolC
LPWSTAANGSLSLSLSPATFIVPDEHEAERRRRLLQREDSYWELRRNVLSRYYRLLSEEANLELTRESVDAARRRWQEAQRRYEQGRVSDFDVLQARVQYENARPELTELEAGYRQQLREFGRLLGLERDREIALSASMPDILFDRGAGELRTRFVEGHTSVEQERLDIEQIDLALRRNRLSLWPSLSTRLSYGYANADPFAKELSFDERWSGSGRVELSLSVPLDPLLPGSSRRREARDLEDQLRIARNELSETRAATAAGIETAVTRIENARERITALEQSAELASRAYELAEQRYEAGATDRTTLEDAELERERAQVALLEQRLAFATGLIELEYHLRAELEELPW